MADSLSVLLVDPDAEFLATAAEALSEHDHAMTVETAADVSNGLDRLHTEPVDCVVSEYRFPESDGLTFLEAVRDRHAALPFVMATAHGSELVAAEAMGLDATRYLPKEDRASWIEDLAAAIRAAVDATEYRQRTEQYRTVVEAVGDAMYLLDTDGVVRLANRAMGAMIGADPAEIEGSHASEYLPEEDVQRASQLILDIIADPDRDWGTIDVTALTATGQSLPVEANVAPIFANGELGGSVGVVRDVSERKEREERLELYETAVESTLDGIAVMNESGEYVLVNQVFAEMIGLSPDDFEGLAIQREFFKHVIDIPEDIVDQHRAAQEIAQREGSAQFRYEAVIDAVEGEVTIENNVTAQRRADGSVIFVTTTRDITERKARERELERQNERLDGFASVVSHDLRTPLSVASGRLELAMNDCESEHLAAVEDAITRMDALIDQTLAMARQGRTVGETGVVDLDAMVTACWEAIDRPTATVDAAALPDIRADPDRLRQVFENLFRNAVEHSGEAVTVRIGPLDDGFFVADDGPGIPENEREDVLSPGYSTADEGTGFGLAIVREIVEAHGWTITVGEGDAGGARFDIRGVEIVG